MSIGKSIALVSQGVSGIVNVMPFGCMPGTIVAGVMKTIRKHFDLPFISVAYDGTRSPTNELLLEAFMSQATLKAKRL